MASFDQYFLAYGFNPGQANQDPSPFKPSQTTTTRPSSDWVCGRSAAEPVFKELRSATPEIQSTCQCLGRPEFTARRRHRRA